MFKKLIAKKIISSGPLSFAPGISFLRKSFEEQIKTFDIFLQDWALIQADSFSKKDWEDVQFRKIRKILCHAGKNIPYWKNLFRRINFDPSRISNLTDIQKIPTITRSEMQNIPIADLLAVNVPKKRFVQAFTSGSTGEPFRFYKDKKDLFRREINNLQEFRYVGFNFKQDKILIINLYPHRDLDNFGKRIDIRDIEDDQKRKNTIYPLILSLQPKLLVSTPSFLESFLDLCEKDGFRPKIERICYMGEMLSADAREKLENFFSASVYSTYGTSESSLLGIQCSKGSQHLAPWMNFVESVNGKIVVTTFENELMPFIRYEIGDEGELLEGSCLCGRSSTLLQFKGRVAGFFELADGSQVQLISIVQYFAEEYSKRIKKFQFEQSLRGVLLMRYAPMDLNDIYLERDITSYYNSRFKDRLNVIFHRTNNILPGEAGKTPLFIKTLK